MNNIILYKYLNINKYTYDLLEKRIMHYSFPHEFNDPFDCFMVADYRSKDPDDWKKYLERLGYPPLVQSFYFNEFKKNNFDSDLIFKKYYETKHTNYDKSLIVSCFTSRNNNFPMWAHYANNHTGICVGFHAIQMNKNDKKYYGLYFDEDNHTGEQKPFSNFFLVTKVKYNNHLPETYNGLVDEPEATIKFILSKYIDWKYEDEYRSILLYNDYKRQNFRFYQSMLAEVIIGIKTSPDVVEKIKTILKANYIDKGYKVDLYHAEHAQKDYRINFLPIPL